MRRFFLKLFKRRQLESDLESELAFHREMAAEQGNSISFGNATAIKEESFELWRFVWIENLYRDMIYAARALRRSPAFLLSALLSLGLGIGVNTIIFSLATEFLLSEPSVQDPSSLAYLRLGGNSHVDSGALDFIQRSGVFPSVAGVNEEAYIN